MSDEQKTTIPSEGYLVFNPQKIHVLKLGLRWKNGVLQQPWQDTYSGEIEWRDVPQAEEDPAK